MLGMAPQTKGEDVQEMAAMKTVITKMQVLVPKLNCSFYPYYLL